MRSLNVFWRQVLGLGLGLGLEAQVLVNNTVLYSVCKTEQPDC